MDISAYLEAYRRGNLSAEGFATLLEGLVSSGGADSRTVIAQLEQSYKNGQVPLDVFVSLVDAVRRSTGQTTETPATSSPSSGPDTGTAAPPSVPADSGPTGSAPPEDSTQVNTGGPLQPGAVIKERFVVERVLGIGGMGVVYKAVDKVREEARDRNPHVALKVLNADFQKHPDSIIALQRESSRTQRLAHPNIATVYDFDRTADTVFMTMELLEGVPLDAFIKYRSAEGGMRFEDALPIIRGLGSALGYAHQHGIVHSDFKPGNAFLTKNNTVKVLDFGIARAVKRPGDSDTTLFDASDLGALTPAYASPEMHDGADTNPRDDIYALACVAYELLAGRHPFNRLPANQARARELVPAPVPGLSRRQMRALRRGLAFERSERSASVEQLVSELAGERPRRGRLALAASVLAAVVLALAGVWAYQSYQAQAYTELVQRFRQGDEAARDAIVLDTIGLKASLRSRFAQEVREDMLAHVQERVRALTRHASGHYDYPAAQALLTAAQRWYPDSARLQAMVSELAGRKAHLLRQLREGFEAHLAAGRLLAQSGQADVIDVLELIARIEPGHPLLHDTRLIRAYETRAQAALEEGRREEAAALVAAGLDIAPGDPGLQSLRYRMEEPGGAPGEEAPAQRLAGALDSLDSLQDFERLRPDVLALRSAQPASELLDRVSRRLERLLDARLQELTGQGASEKASALLARHAELVSPLYLEVRREQLAAGAGGPFEALSAAAAAPGQAQRRELEALLAEPTLDAHWEQRVLELLQALEGILPAGDDWLAGRREEAARLYVAQARGARESGDLARARDLLERARRFGASLPVIQAELEVLASIEAAREREAREREAREQELARKAREEEARRREEQARREARAEARRQAEVEARREAERAQAARLDALKQRVLSTAQAGEPEQAREALAELGSELPSDDAFVRREGPRVIASSYARLARERAQSGEYSRALELVARGLEVDQSNADLRSARSRYRSAQLAERLQRAVPGIGGAGELRELGPALRELRSLDPQALRGILPQLVDALAARIATLAGSDPEQGRSLWQTATELLPESERLREAEPATSLRPVVILARADPDRDMSWSLEEYSTRVAKVMANQVVGLSDGRKITIYLVVDQATTREAKFEGSQAAVSRRFCEKQEAGRVFLGVFTPAGSHPLLGGDFDASRVEYAMLDCDSGRKRTRDYSINSSHKDEFAYEAGIRKSFSDFLTTYSPTLN